MPSDIASGVPASTACSSGVRGPVEADEREGERMVERVLLRGVGHPGPRLDRAGRTHLDEFVGQLSTGGRVPLHGWAPARTSLQRIPRIRFSVRAVMKAPTTGPSDRLYGNVIVLSTKRVMTTRPPLSVSEQRGALHWPLGEA